MQQIKAAIPQGKDQDNQNIRQLIMTPAMALPASQLNTGQAPQGMISGLVTLLQLSLSARLTRGQQTRAESIAKVVNSILPAVGKAPAKVSAKGLTEFSQLEQKNQLLKEIGRLLASHQASKLSNAEQLLQGQESFYYNIPTMLGGAFKQAELLIKREEQQQQDNSQQHTQGHTWQLTMKFSVGDMGELLSKAKLRPDSLDVNFYASNDTVKHLVMNYLPLLKRRLASLGIEISKSHCQLGKIPESLQQRPYHVFQTKV